MTLEFLNNVLSSLFFQIRENEIKQRMKPEQIEADMLVMPFLAKQVLAIYKREDDEAKEVKNLISSNEDAINGGRAI